MSSVNVLGKSLGKPCETSSSSDPLCLQWDSTRTPTITEVLELEKINNVRYKMRRSDWEKGFVDMFVATEDIGQQRKTKDEDAEHGEDLNHSEDEEENKYEEENKDEEQRKDKDHSMSNSEKLDKLIQMVRDLDKRVVVIHNVLGVKFNDGSPNKEDCENEAKNSGDKKVHQMMKMKKIQLLKKQTLGMEEVTSPTQTFNTPNFGTRVSSPTPRFTSPKFDLLSQESHSGKGTNEVLMRGVCEIPVFQPLMKIKKRLVQQDSQVNEDVEPPLQKKFKADTDNVPLRRSERDGVNPCKETIERRFLWPVPPECLNEGVIFKEGSVVDAYFNNGCDDAEGKLLIVDICKIRPSPSQDLCTEYSLNDYVEVVVTHGWRKGRVMEILLENKYKVYFAYTKEDAIFNYTEIRLSMEWLGGSSWIKAHEREFENNAATPIRPAQESPSNTLVLESDEDDTVNDDATEIKSYRESHNNTSFLEATETETQNHEPVDGVELPLPQESDDMMDDIPQGETMSKSNDKIALPKRISETGTKGVVLKRINKRSNLKLVGKKGLLFSFGEQLMRFSLREFHLGTGLPCVVDKDEEEVTLRLGATILVEGILMASNPVTSIPEERLLRARNFKEFCKDDEIQFPLCLHWKETKLFSIEEVDVKCIFGDPELHSDLVEDVDCLLNIRGETMKETEKSKETEAATKTKGKKNGVRPPREVDHQEEDDREKKRNKKSMWTTVIKRVKIQKPMKDIHKRKMNMNNNKRMTHKSMQMWTSMQNKVKIQKPMK
ncbi:unnamed protein product [Brassica oleracea]